MTIPADMRRALGYVAGDCVQFVQVEPGAFLLMLNDLSMTELKGMLGKLVSGVTVEG